MSIIPLYVPAFRHLGTGAILAPSVPHNQADQKIFVPSSEYTYARVYSGKDMNHYTIMRAFDVR
jgi:hypothetical protein